MIICAIVDQMHIFISQPISWYPHSTATTYRFVVMWQVVKPPSISFPSEVLPATTICRPCLQLPPTVDHALTSYPAAPLATSCHLPHFLLPVPFSTIPTAPCPTDDFQLLPLSPTIHPNNFSHSLTAHYVTAYCLPYWFSPFICHLLPYLSPTACPLHYLYVTCRILKK